MSDSGLLRRGCFAGASPHRRLLPVLVVWLLVAGCHSESPLERVAELQREGQREEAMEILRDEIAAGNREPELLYRYGVALARSGGISPALWPLREAATDPEWFAPAILEIARGAYRTGNYDFAVDELAELIEREPEKTDALKLRAMARLQSRRDYEGALEDIERVTELDPAGSDMQIPRIVALLGLERIEEAGDALAEMSSEDLEEGDESAETFGDGFEILACASLAKFAEESGDMEGAQARYDECLERFPAASLVIKESLDFYEKLGDFKRVEEILREAYLASPEDRSIRIAWARTLQLEDRVDEAEEILRKAVESLLAGAWLDLGGFLVDVDRLPEALEVYEQGYEAGASGPIFLLAYGEALLEAERYAEARAVADRIEVAAHAAMLRGRVALAEGRAVEALESLSEGTLLWPDNAVARYFAARAAEQVGDFDRAIEEYRYAIRLDADATEAREKVARIHLAENNIEAALYMVRFQSPGSAPSPRSEVSLMLEIEALGQSGDAERVLSRDLQLKLQDPAIWGRAVAALARGAWRRGGAEAASTAVRTAARVDLEDASAVPALRVLVDSLAAQGKAEEALAAARKAAERNPDAPEHLAILASALHAAGKFPDAAEGFEGLLAQDPENRQLLLGRARAHHAVGDSALAREVLLRAEALPLGEDAEVARGEAELWLALGEYPPAEARLRDVLSLEPHDGAAAEALAEVLVASGGAEAEIAALRQRASRFGVEPRSS